MTPKLAWTALTRWAAVLHPNEPGKGHTEKTCTSVLINAGKHNHEFINSSGQVSHTFTSVWVAGPGMTLRT